ncbi:hypothetical protein EBZ39_11060 [bacterium]|nr:hypothetical protein [bacterium]
MLSKALIAKRRREHRGFRPECFANLLGQHRGVDRGAAEAFAADNDARVVPHEIAGTVDVAAAGLDGGLGHVGRGDIPDTVGFFGQVDDLGHALDDHRHHEVAEEHAVGGEVKMAEYLLLEPGDRSAGGHPERVAALAHNVQDVSREVDDLHDAYLQIAPATKATLNVYRSSQAPV